jgi:hypothetical protein
MKTLLLFCIFLLQCGKENPVGPVRTSTELNYGDTLITRISYQKLEDTSAAGGTAVEIAVVLRNTSGRILTLDSAWNGTYLNVTAESGGLPVWASPAVFLQDSAAHPVTLNAGDSSCYKDRWKRLDFQRHPLPAGRYVINGSILGFRTSDLVFEQM